MAVTKKTQSTLITGAKEFKKNVDILLGSEIPTKRLIGVLSLYGRLYYDWTLSTDIIEWRGPIQRLIKCKSNTITGDMFLRQLTFEDFNKRISKLAECFKTRKTFEMEYHLSLGDNLYCLIEEKAELLFTQAGIPAKILGSIYVLPQALALKQKSPVIKDKETGVLSASELEKMLSASILKSQRDKIYGAFISLSVDKLTNIVALSGEDGLKKVLNFVVQNLQKNIRENDSIGRLNGNTFGLVLHNCDRWGIVSASERLLDAIQKTELSIGNLNAPISVSSGGAVYPCETLASHDLMHEAELALMDAQQTRGISRYWAPSIIKGGSDKPPEKKATPKGRRRKID